METVGQVIRMSNMRDGYVAIVKAIAEHGDKVAPRGHMTREFQCTTLIVENPLDTLPTGVGRGLVPGIAAVESAQLLAGESRPGLTISVSPTFANFTEDNNKFHGAYGPRTAEYNQFETVARRLSADPYSRQTVVMIWNPKYDTQDAKKDYPCTVMYHFMLRNARLHMEVVMRSNDVILGLGYDAFQHSRVQVAMASCLGAELGEYRHHVMSLHLYERDLKKVEQLHAPAVAPKFLPTITGRSWAEIKHKAVTCLDYAEDPMFSAEQSRKLDTGQMWYVLSMREAITHNRSKRSADA